MTGLLRAWIVLVAASAATTAFAVLQTHGLWVAVALLSLALVKSRVILTDYLQLNRVPAVRRGFMAVLILWAGVALGLVFAAQP
jgi:hypothetical protein